MYVFYSIGADEPRTVMKKEKLGRTKYQAYLDVRE